MIGEQVDVSEDVVIFIRIIGSLFVLSSKMPFPVQSLMGFKSKQNETFFFSLSLYLSIFFFSNFMNRKRKNMSNLHTAHHVNSEIDSNHSIPRVFFFRYDELFIFFPPDSYKCLNCVPIWFKQREEHTETHCKLVDNDPDFLRIIIYSLDLFIVQEKKE